MKKSTLALSVAAALGGLGFASNALAIGEIAGATAGSTMTYSADGIGHELVFPYFSVQGDNATLLNITNTDTANGKLVKVRFRGAANSDDLFDFQLLLSPGDVWTGSLTQNASTGVALLKTVDTSCTLPAAVRETAGSQFSTGRVDPTPAKGSPTNETREGYVEVLNMANIPVNTTTGSLYTTIKHVANKAPCDAAVLEAKLGSDYATYAQAVAAGMTAPTGGLTGDWIILNQANTAAWSGSAHAIRAELPGGAIAAANLVFWPQKFGDPLLATTTSQLTGQAVTADPIFVNQVVKIQQYDLPDLSTPYVAADGVGANAAAVRANASSALFAVTTIKNQFVSTTDINAVTDFLFSQPTRRYAVAVNYKAASSADNTLAVGTAASAIYRTIGASSYYNAANTDLVNRQVCLNNLSVPAQNSLFNREETTPGVGENPFVISPNDPGAPTVFRLCGETAVASINAASDASPSALSASVVRNNVLFAAGYENGWASFDTFNGGFGLPVLGASFIRASNGLVNYGFAWAHKVTRVGGL